MFRAVGGLMVMAIVVAIAGCGPDERRLATDAELRGQFEQHRAAFDSLVAAAVADTQLVSVYRGATLGIYVRGTAAGDRLLTADEVQASGRSEYGRLLESVGLRKLDRQGREPHVTFVMSANRRLTKGLVHTLGSVAPQRATLDDIDGSGPVTTAYVPLAPGWYLFVLPAAE